MSLTSFHSSCLVRKLPDEEGIQDELTTNPFFFACLTNAQITRRDSDNSHAVEGYGKFAVASRIWRKNENEGIVGGVRTPAMEFVSMEPPTTGVKQRPLRWLDFPPFEIFKPTKNKHFPHIDLSTNDLGIFGRNNEVKPFKPPPQDPPLKMIFAHEIYDDKNPLKPTYKWGDVEYDVRVM